MTSRKLRKSPGAGFGQYPDSVFKEQVGFSQRLAAICVYRETFQGMEDLHPQMVKQARSSGQLNLSNRGLVAVPAKVWTIGELDADEQRKVSQASMDQAMEENWWEQVDMTKLILACNKISEISPQISNLLGLQVLDLHDNQLAALPETLAELQQLTKLNLSHNRLSSLPDCVFSLVNLRVLQCSNNALEEVGDGLGKLVMLNSLDLAHNKLKTVPGDIGFLSHVSSLNLSHNQLTMLPPEMGSMTMLANLELTSNQLVELPKAMEGLTHLEVIHVRHNRLASLPSLTHCVKLKELHLGNNKIAELLSEHLEAVATVATLDLRDNCISSLPEDIVKLQCLERLDLTNNNLANLPPALGVLPHLKSVQLDGNPLKSIRRDVLARGTVGLLKFLRSRLEEGQVTISPCELDHTALPNQVAELAKAGNVSPVPRSGSPDMPDAFTMRNTHSLNLCKKELVELPSEVVVNAVEAKVQAVDLSKNQLAEFPPALEQLMPQLHELNVSSNKLTKVPSFIAGGLIQFLDLSNNKLSELPMEVAGMQHLREIILSVNQFPAIPDCIFSCSKLETILIANNQVATIEVEQLARLPKLAILDLQNNAIQTVPPQLGNVTQLRQVQLEGNLFRVPRAAVLVQGTAALMAYLRDRIPK